MVESRSSRDEKQAAAEKHGVDVEDSGSEPVDNGKRKADKESQPAYDESLIKALHQCYFWLWWTAGILTLFSSA